MQSSIFIAVHKPCIILHTENYLPIQVGKSLSQVNLEILGDDTGQNISHLNQEFCELTALYWIWRNCDADFIGLVHYRRYFINNCGDEDYPVLFDTKQLPAILTHHNSVIAPFPHILLHDSQYETVETQFVRATGLNDWQRLRSLIQERHPEYMHSFEIISAQNQICICNMFISPHSFLHQYCNWLFPILFEMYAFNGINMQNYTPYQKRLYGFLSERLFNVYLHYQNTHITYVNTIITNT